MTTEYEEQALNFLEKTKSTLEITFNKFSDRFGAGIVTMEFKFKLCRGSRSYEALFNSSINDLHNAIKAKYNDYKISTTCILFNDRLNETISGVNSNNRLKENFIAMLKLHNLIPTRYDILACLGFNSCENLDEFIQEYGYEIKSVTDYKKAEEIFEALQRESTSLKMLYNDDELELLSEIN